MIQGRFRNQSAGTIVTLNMRMAWPVIIFWLPMMLYLASCSVAADSSGPGGYGTRLGLIGMVLFMYFLASVCFAI